MTSDPWRFTCPNGHQEWYRCTGGWGQRRPTVSQFYCRACKRNGLDPRHDHVIDKKTGQKINTAPERAVA